MGERKAEFFKPFSSLHADDIASPDLRKTKLGKKEKRVEKGSKERKQKKFKLITHLKNSKVIKYLFFIKC